MNTMPIEILKHIETCMKGICSKDKNKAAYLRYVYLKFDGKKVKIQASDGYVMTERFFACETDFTGEYEISTESQKLLSLLINTKAHQYILTKEDENLKVSLNNCPIDVYFNQSSLKNGFDRVIKDHENIRNGNETFVDVKFNPELLLNVFKAMKTEEKEKGIRIRIPITNEDGVISQRPVAMVVSKGDDTALIMPMKL
jgi:DNA polymerase III sliding clamp (beta) subunit (PCNA family)